MTSFLEKSKQSIAAAKKLVEVNYYPSTVNRAYYASFQHSMHIIYNKLNIDRDKFNNEVQYNNKGTHGYAFHLLGLEIIKKDKNEYRWFQRKTMEFKKLREEADYHEVEITQPMGYDSIQSAESIINLLNQLFK